MNGKYTVESTAHSTYVDKRNKAIQGFVVYFTITEFSESHEVLVPSLDETIVDKAISDIVANREKLAQLGQAKSK